MCEVTVPQHLHCPLIWVEQPPVDVIALTSVAVVLPKTREIPLLPVVLVYVMVDCGKVEGINSRAVNALPHLEPLSVV